MLTSKLACGPMSEEIIEAVFRYSQSTGKQLMLICSRNQVDQNDGYVFTTEEYAWYITQMRSEFPGADVIICRDHCGPGFGSEKLCGLGTTKDTIKCDLENGFDLIHIDLCHLRPPDDARVSAHNYRLGKTLELMQFALSIKPDVMFEIGTDENVGVAEENVDRIMSDIRACQSVANPVFYVVQTGSLIYEIGQVGSFDSEKVQMMHKALRGLGTKLKEHNADYLSAEQIASRRGLVDAVNIAPQLGVVQTSYVLSQALIYGIDIKPFVDAVVNGRRWEKWVPSSGNPQSMLICLAAGHYHFCGIAYRELVDRLSGEIDVKEGIISEITRVLEHYSSRLE